jgi:proliferating cell nuclear antigen PCNA
MFEARLLEGSVFKLIIESIKDLVADANVDISEEDLTIQCMDSSHCALVDVSLQAAAFDHYRCDKPQSLGIKPPNFSKILKMMNKDDIVILKADDDGDTLTMMFESNKDSKTIADFGTCDVIGSPFSLSHNASLCIDGIAYCLCLVVRMLSYRQSAPKLLAVHATRD